MKRRRIKLKTGDVFALPLCDGTYGLGHIVKYEWLAICALFGRRSSRPEELLCDLDEALTRPIAVITLIPDELKSGNWPVLDFMEPKYPPAWIPKLIVNGIVAEGAEFSTAHVGVSIVEAYHGLIPWDDMADPRYYEKKLLPGVPVPSTVRYQRDFAPCTQPVPAAAAEPTPKVTEGPAEIHIAVLYPGKDLPTVEQLHRRQELERRLEAEEVGEVTDAGAGEGVMDIYLATDDVQRAMPIVERLVAELGMAEDTLIEAASLDEGDGDDDDDDDDDDGKEEADEM